MEIIRSFLWQMSSRSQRSRPIWAWILQCTIQYLFFASIDLFDIRQQIRVWADTFFDGDVGEVFRIAFILSSSLPWFLALGVYGSFYYFRPSFSHKYQTQAFAWDCHNTPADRITAKKFLDLMKIAFLNFLSTKLCWSLTWVYIFFFPYFFDMYNKDYDVYLQSLPGSWDVFVNIMCGLVIFDFTFYWIHRMFHENKDIYKYHKYHHEFFRNTSLAGVHNQEIDDTLTTIVCGLFPIWFLGFDCLTIIYWNILNIFHSAYDHSNYHFPVDPFNLIPFGDHSDSHDYHHSHPNDGNYGLYFRFWDIVNGTCTKWNTFATVRDEALIYFNNHPTAEEYECPDTDIVFYKASNGTITPYKHHSQEEIEASIKLEQYKTEKLELEKHEKTEETEAETDSEQCYTKKQQSKVTSDSMFSIVN